MPVKIPTEPAHAEHVQPRYLGERARRDEDPVPRRGLRQSLSRAISSISTACQSSSSAVASASVSCPRQTALLMASHFSAYQGGSPNMPRGVLGEGSVLPGRASSTLTIAI